MRPHDNLSYLNDIDKRIIVKNGQKKSIQSQINKLNDELVSLDAELIMLHTQKRTLGKAQYGNPVTRRELIDAGADSKDLNIRVAANQLEQLGFASDKDTELTDEIIDYMILLDNNFRMINKNSIDPTMLLNKRPESNNAGDEQNDN